MLTGGFDLFAKLNGTCLTFLVRLDLLFLTLFVIRVGICCGETTVTLRQGNLLIKQLLNGSHNI